MDGKLRRTKQSRMSMQFTSFRVPPCEDVLILTKECPLGALAAKKMLDYVSPSQFELVEIDDDVVEAILIKSNLFLRVERDTLIDAILEEAKEIVGPSCMISMKCDITITVTREL